MAATLAQIGSSWPTFAQIGSQISPTIERCPLKQRADGTKRTSFCVTFRNAWLKRRAKECLLTQKSNVTLPQTTKVLVYYGTDHDTWYVLPACCRHAVLPSGFPHPQQSASKRFCTDPLLSQSLRLPPSLQAVWFHENCTCAE